MIEWADFPSGQTGFYGTGTIGRQAMLDGTPWVNLPGASSTSGLLADPDPNVPVGSVAFLVSRGPGSPIDTPGATLVLQSPTANTLWCASRVWYRTFSGTASETIFAFAALSDGRTGYEVRKELNGALSVRRRVGLGSPSVLATTSSPILTTNSWIHLSFQVNPTTGQFSVQREGVTVLSGTDPSPLAVSMGFFKSFKDATGEDGFFLKDFVIGNGSGSQNTGHPGSVSVFDLRPVADDSLGGWTPSTGSTGWNLIDESPPNDADFISADDSPPAPAIFELSDLPPDVTSVRGLLAITRSRKTDGGDANLEVSLSPDGTNWDVGEDRAISTAQTYRYDVSEQSPATAAPWTPVEVDTLQIRVDRTV